MSPSRLSWRGDQLPLLSAAPPVRQPLLVAGRTHGAAGSDKSHCCSSKSRRKQLCVHCWAAAALRTQPTGSTSNHCKIPAGTLSHTSKTGPNGCPEGAELSCPHRSYRQRALSLAGGVCMARAAFAFCSGLYPDAFGPGPSRLH